jgi:hypothetical protein
MTIRYSIETYRRETGASVLAHRPIARREFHAATVEDGLMNIGECLKDVFAASADLGFGPLAVRTVIRATDVGALARNGVLDDIEQLHDRLARKPNFEGWELPVIDALGELARMLKGKPT